MHFSFPLYSAFQVNERPVTELLDFENHYGEAVSGTLVVSAYDGDMLLDYVFLNTDLVGATGYSGFTEQKFVDFITDYEKLQSVSIKSEHFRFIQAIKFQTYIR